MLLDARITRESGSPELLTASHWQPGAKTGLPAVTQPSGAGPRFALFAARLR